MSEHTFPYSGSDTHLARPSVEGNTRTEAGPDSRALSMEVGMIRRLFLLWGAEGDEGGEEAGEESGSEQEPNPTATPTTRELTAEEIENMTARAADRSARKTKKDLAKEYGFDNVSSFEEWVKSQREAEREAMDEKDRAVAEAEQARQQAEALRNNLASERLDLAIERQVVATGITDTKKLQRVAALVRLDLDSDIINEEDVWDESITAALSAVKEDTPELFGATGSNFGSGDGGARGKPTPDDDPEAEQRKKFEKQFADKGMVTYDPNAY